MTAIESAKISSTVVVGDDTDLLILLCYHADMNASDIYFAPEPKKNAKQPKFWNIKYTKNQLGLNVCKHLLFIHAILGCDSTSRVFGIGKGAAFKKICSSPLFLTRQKCFTKI